MAKLVAEAPADENEGADGQTIPGHKPRQAARVVWRHTKGLANDADNGNRVAHAALVGEHGRADGAYKEDLARRREGVGGRDGSVIRGDGSRSLDI